MDASKLRIVEVGYLEPIKRNLGNLSQHLEYKLLNPNNGRKLITEQETWEKLREIIKQIENL